MYRLIGMARSRAFRVLWALEEMNLPYSWDPAPPHGPAVRGAGGEGKIPLLVAEGETLTDSTAILAFLADRHGRLTHPPGSIARARQDAAMQRALDELEGPLWVAARHSFVLPEERRMPAIKDSLRWEFAANVARIGDRLEGPYVAGEALTIADIVLAHCLVWAKAAKFPWDSAPMAAYLDRVTRGEGYRRAVEAAA